MTNEADRCDREIPERDELAKVQKFAAFLQEGHPNGLNLDPKQAMVVIWFLQEHGGFIPSNYEMCENCTTVFDSDWEGLCEDETGHHYCGQCS